jgi:hypothetical protein
MFIVRGYNGSDGLGVIVGVGVGVDVEVGVFVGVGLIQGLISEII